MADSSADVVLVVDDDPQIRSVFSEYLGDSFEVRTAQSGTEALEELEEGVDVVLLDRRMPGMPGEQLLAQLREEGYDPPVAMVTAVEPDFDVLEMGFDAYVVKPVFQEDLRDLVETMLLRRQFDEVIREYFSLVSKVTALKQEKDRDELDGHEGYVRSEDRLEAIKEEARTALEVAIETGKFDQIFRDTARGELEFDALAASERSATQDD